jgi:hypothetical protein
MEPWQGPQLPIPAWKSLPVPTTVTLSGVEFSPGPHALIQYVRERQALLELIYHPVFKR